MQKLAIYLSLILLIVAGCSKDEATLDDIQITPNDFLSDKKYDKLIIEIQYSPGFEPSAASVANLKSFLEQRLNKPAGISIEQKSIFTPGKLSYSVDDLRNIENSNRTQKNSGKTLTAYFFFAEGDYAGNSGNSKVLGVAYGSSSMAIFQKTVMDYSGGVTEPPKSTLETVVMLHEFGHILGLVNNGTPMAANHQDEAHGKHCDDQNCLMYYAAQTTDVVANIIGGNVPELNASCIADLKANGGK